MIKYLLIPVLIVFSAFFSSSEIAYTSLNRLRLDKLADEGRRCARLARYIHSHFKFALSGMLIGNSLVNIAASSVATLIVIEWLGGDEGWASTLATLLITVLILIFGEIAPKIWGKKRSLRFAVAVAFPVFAMCLVLFWPVSAVALLIVSGLSRLWKKPGEEPQPTLTEDELSTMIETAEEEDVLDEDQGDLLRSAIDFSDTTVEDILVPRVLVEGYDVSDDFSVLRDLAENTRYSRLLIYEGSIDHVLGVLYLNHFFKALAASGGQPVDVRALLIEPPFVHKTLRLPAALSSMRRAQAQMAVVIDEYGGTMGIVTMEDILEEIVGDIWDESDDIEYDVTETGDGVYDVDGMTGIYDFFDEIDFDDRDFESAYTTMGGWATEMLDADPHEGDSFSYRNLYVIVTEMSDNIVTRLSVTVTKEQQDED
ncbi:MAG: HlyC/CorC family transporter [Clostridia bacterium]|nr:HlyC/CorC family transporter [Clostridia bacterium]